MKFVDPSPPSSPSVAQQLDALRKGLGRAMQWAVAGKLDDAPLLQACLQDLRHDMQVEGSRSAWLWQLVLAVNGAERFRGPLLNELRALPDKRSADQLCELAYIYAATGEQDFRKRLYEIVEQNEAPEGSRTGEDEILRLDGIEAFVFVASVRGGRLGSKDWDWDDGSFMRDAVELLGEDQISKLLASTKDKSLRRFYQGWMAERNESNEQHCQQSHRQRMQAISVDAIIAQAERGHASGGAFRGWGMVASTEDLERVLEALWSAKEPAVISSYLRVFSGRALPTFDARMIQFCNHSDPQVRHQAFNVLAMNAHPLVRDFAIANIRDGLRDKSFGNLLIRNYVSGDENFMLDALELPQEVNELHWLLDAVIRVLESNPEADPSRLALTAYANTPCENCRFDAAKLLRSHAPDWMRAECALDSNAQCRDLFSATASGLSSDASAGTNARGPA